MSVVDRSETKEQPKISQGGTATPVAAPSESAPMRVMSSEDSIVADLVKEQPTLAQIQKMVVTERRAPDLLAFPEECLPLHGKQYRYAWLAKGKDLAASLRTSGWVLCNRTNSPHIKAHRFGTHGALEQAGMLLAFMPEDLAREFYLAPVRQSQGRVKYMTKDILKDQDKDAPIRFYKPEDHGDKDDA